MTTPNLGPRPSAAVSQPIRVYHRQFGPLEVNSNTGELFLRLRKHKDVIITPPRSSDAQDLLPQLNDPSVYRWLDNLPVPCTLATTEPFMNRVKAPCEETIAQLDEAAQKDLPDLITVEHQPVRFLRHIRMNDKGEQVDVLIGYIGLTRTQHGELFTSDGELRDEIDWDAKEVFDKKNGPEMMQAGNPRIIWEPTYWLAPAYHGQGIVPDALDTIIHEWCVPRMGARRFLGLLMSGNQNSRRVFEKHGFVFVKEHPVYKKVRGEEKGVQIFKLELQTE